MAGRMVSVRADDLAEALRAVKFVLDLQPEHSRRLRVAYERLREPVQDELEKQYSG